MTWLSLREELDEEFATLSWRRTDVVAAVYQVHQWRLCKRRERRAGVKLTVEQRLRKRSTDRRHQTKRYRTDQAYRARQLADSKARSRARYARIKADPKRWARKQALWRAAYARRKKAQQQESGR